ncbi:MAG: FecR family protein, partial [Chitinophagaceae bacterium]
MPSPHPYTVLFQRLLEGKLSPADTETLVAWLGSDGQDPEAASLILAQLQQMVAAEAVSPELVARLESKLPAILGHAKPAPARVHFLKKPWLRYAAAIIIVLFGAVAYLWITNSRPSKQMAAADPACCQQEIVPGKEGAILTLADGSTVVLDSLGNGVITTQNGSKVLLTNGQLAYNAEGAAGAETAYNTMTTPKGRQFRVVLSDGTKVWLNAASSLRYPIVFTGNERKVEITGEAYFEVAKNTDPATGRKRPFHVKVNDRTEIEVLGTHFNINSYK